jgi:hypothetical protein
MSRWSDPEPEDHAMRTASVLLELLSLAAAAPLAAHAALPPREAPPPEPPAPIASDWLRGGCEPEAVFGPRRFAVPGRTLADASRERFVRPRTALRQRID